MDGVSARAEPNLLCSFPHRRSIPVSSGKLCSGAHPVSELSAGRSNIFPLCAQTSWLSTWRKLVCGLREWNLRDLSIRTKVSQVPECVSELGPEGMVLLYLPSLYGIAMVWWEQPGNRGDFLGHWAHGPLEFPSVLAGLGWSLRTKGAQGNLHWRYFHSQNSVAWVKILPCFLMLPLWSGGTGLSPASEQQKGIFWGYVWGDVKLTPWQTGS